MEDLLYVWLGWSCQFHCSNPLLCTFRRQCYSDSIQSLHDIHKPTFGSPQCKREMTLIDLKLGNGKEFPVFHFLHIFSDWAQLKWVWTFVEARHTMCAKMDLIDQNLVKNGRFRCKILSGIGKFGSKYVVSSQLLKLGSSNLVYPFIYFSRSEMSKCAGFLGTISHLEYFFGSVHNFSTVYLLP